MRRFIILLSAVLCISFAATSCIDYSAVPDPSGGVILEAAPLGGHWVRLGDLTVNLDMVEYFSLVQGGCYKVVFYASSDRDVPNASIKVSGEVYDFIFTEVLTR